MKRNERRRKKTFKVYAKRKKGKKAEPNKNEKQRNIQISVINLCKRLICLQKLAVAIIFYGFVLWT